MEERRKTGRLQFKDKAVVVVCDTMERHEVEVLNLSPLGMGIMFNDKTPDIVGKDIIIVTETLIMYATVTRMDKAEDGRIKAGIAARKFTPEILEYLFESIGGEQRADD